MQKLDFRSFEQKTWEIGLCDEQNTTLHLTAPSEELVETLSVNLSKLNEVFSERNESTVAQAFDLAAKFMSCNTEGLTLTGDELRNKYGFKSIYMAAFFKHYIQFVNEINDAKN